VVRQFLYPAFLSPPSSLNLSDQFGFRPSGSTTAALISIPHSVTSLLHSNDFVAVIALDFSKAFDAIRHRTLLDKMALLDLPDEVYNWMVDYFSGHTHCTKYGEVTSAMRAITVSIVQGSGIGPASYLETSDLQTVNPGNLMVKYADDTYLVIPACNVQSRAAELDNVEAWAEKNNLRLNRRKSVEIIFTEGRCRRQCRVIPPPHLPEVTRVTKLKTLGVTISSSLSVTICACSPRHYLCLRVLRNHDMGDAALQTIFRAVVVAKLLYSTSAWWGFTTAADRQRVEAVLRAECAPACTRRSGPPLRSWSKVTTTPCCVE